MNPGFVPVNRFLDSEQKTSAHILMLITAGKEATDNFQGSSVIIPADCLLFLTQDMLSVT